MDWAWRASLVTVAAVFVLAAIAWSFTRRTLRIVAVLIVGATALIFIRWDAGAGKQDLATRFTDSFRTVVGWFWKLLLGRDIEVNTAAWVAFLAIVVVGYLGLEMLAAHRESPRVDIAAADPHDSEITQNLLAELRFRLPAVALRKPGPLPGASRGETVATVVEQSEVKGGKLVAGVLRFFTMVLPSPRSYVARLYAERCADWEPETTDCDPRNPELWVTVDLRDRRTDASAGVTTFDRVRLSDAAEHAAAYLASVLLRDDKSTPEWSKPAAERADDLAAFLLCPPSLGYGHSFQKVLANHDTSRDLLEPVARDGPASGIVRYELASLYDLQSRPLEALRLHARTRADFPKFLSARYRLGISLTMAAGDSFEADWQSARRDQQSRRARPTQVADIADYLRRAGLLDRKGHQQFLNDPDTTRFRLQLLDVARRELEAYQRSVGWARWTARKCFSRAERSSSTGLLAQGRSVRTARTIVKSALFLCATRRAYLEQRPGPAPDLDLARQHARDVVDETSPRRRHRSLPWQATYNYACALTLGLAPDADRPALQEADVDLVISLLQQVSEDPANPRAVEWIGRDPDLAALQRNARFIDFVRERIRRDFDITDTDPFPVTDWLSQQVWAVQHPGGAPASMTIAKVRVVTVTPLSG
ncbi:hypothetical protein EV651_108127 [Kribbella sp. VKM Ac-2571]|uniref:hypothetical protein n=1 Tax=Kribbella sp. VKM Ac-2571 TaxID=2512222 RepID=UPI00105EB9AA|nr:hypothetical protein [Kribbella sp. VKM Ac-2571]TDO59783.1 hypothetical protein EV651_108127 [Kribbella sp. VKM Ac-2571]